MKKIFLAATIGVTATLMSFSIPGTWVKYSSTAGHCAMSFPGKPNESMDTSKAENGKTFQIHLATFAPNDNEVYMLGWIDMKGFYPEDKTIKQILEDSRDGATNSLGATDVKTIKTETTGSEPHIEFTFTGPDFVGKDCIYVINKHQYSLITLFAKAKTIPADADKFIASFKYVK
jgi:hypothetical protein